MQESFRPNSFDQPEFIDQQVEKAQKTGLSAEHQARLWKQVQEKLAKNEAHEARLEKYLGGEVDKAYEEDSTEKSAYEDLKPNPEKLREALAYVNAKEFAENVMNNVKSRFGNSNSSFDAQMESFDALDGLV